MYKGLPLLFALFFNIFLFAGLGRVLFSSKKKLICPLLPLIIKFYFIIKGMVENNVFDNFWDASFELLVL